MYYVTSRIWIRLKSTRRGGRYWEMPPELEPGLNGAPYCPAFEARSSQIIVIKTLFWERFTREGFETFPGFEEFRIPRVVVNALGISLGDYYPLFVAWGPLATVQGDKTERLEKVILIAKQGLRFPIRERWTLFDKIASAPATHVATQGHLEIFSLPYNIVERNLVLKEKESVIETIDITKPIFWNREMLFYNHILTSRESFGAIPKNNNTIIIARYAPIKIFSWDHPSQEIVLGKGVYLLTHPFPRRKSKVD